ncbi:ABC transporter ATP-binding protein [Brucella sp. NBRC 12950]|uniref:energy-coupling factor ABC transporter ATP-binding protein n=1 Tax=Brucella sp. NBRC 12950 TaxID=2994518 RepID=UPI0024A2A6A5|nr:ABC transporter ATP-binding protein [Brucella sp. NBRC 12950]GLU29162.1 energy-coupling factor ABC transporter ATP-binding protein [Brucella sp. NBRC 12950]
MALIDVSNLSLSYGDKSILNNLSFGVEKSERLAIVGANGSGKSTLGRLIAGWHVNATMSGSILFEGRPWKDLVNAEHASSIQLVGQIPVQHLSGRAFTVEEEIAFGPENLGLPSSEIHKRVDFALNATNLCHLLERNPFSLSGGEQQRLVIAASLALKPQVLVLDEPFTNLDPQSRDAMLGVLDSLSTDLTIILLETNPGLAATLAERIIFLDNSRLVADGNAREVLFNPRLVERLGLPSVTKAIVSFLGQDHQLASTKTLPLASVQFDAFIESLSDVKN